MFALVYWSPYNLAFETEYFMAMIILKTYNTKKKSQQIISNVLDIIQ